MDEQAHTESVRKARPTHGKVSLASIMEQKKPSRAEASRLHQATAFADEQPKRRLPAINRLNPGLPGSTSADQHTQHTNGSATLTKGETASEKTANPLTTALQAAQQQQQQQPSSTAAPQTSTTASAADTAAADKPRQSLAARLQQLQHNASGTPAPPSAAPSGQSLQQQQQGFASPGSTNKTLNEPTWNRRSRAFRALDALAGKPQQSSSSLLLSSPARSGQGLAAGGGVFGGFASPLRRGAAAAGSGYSAAGGVHHDIKSPAAAVMSATGGGGDPFHSAEEQWDKDLADEAADLLWEDDDHDDHRQRQQQQRRRKRSRQQQDYETADADGVDPQAAAAAAGSSSSRRVNASGSSSRGRKGKRQRSGPAAAAAAVLDHAADRHRLNLLADNADLLLHPAAGKKDTGDLELPAAAAATEIVAAAAAEDVGPPPEPLDLVDTKTGLQLQVPGSITRCLRSYQREGVRFLFKMYSKGRGGVLSDDMGLGKTVQAISFIAALLGKTGTMADALPRSFAAHAKQQQQQQLSDATAAAGSSGNPAAAAAVRWPVLVVAPTSVLDNWIREFSMWGNFKVVKYSSAASSSIHDQAATGALEVLLTSYDQLRINNDDILDIKPHVVIFDEVHRLKNSKSRVYEAIKFGLKTKYRYGLSGTIMPNAHEELWSVLDLLVPGCLGDYKEYSDYYGKPIRKGQSRTAKHWEVKKGSQRLSELQDLLQKVYLRRTKAIIADQLPKKKDNIVFCQLRPLQYRAYDRTLASPDLQVLQRSRDPCDCGSGLMRGQCCHDTVPSSSGGVLWPHYHMCECDDPDCNRHRPEGCAEYYRQQGRDNVRIVCPNCLMLPAISLLQKISNHLDLIRPDARLADQDQQQFEYQLQLASMVLGNDADAVGGLVANSGGWLGASDEVHCGKMTTLRALLAKWSADHLQHNKVLIFSHSTRCLDLLEKFVQRVGYDYVRLDGTTPQKQRQVLVDEFNSRPSIFLFLMSTLAGGVGLNLTAANKVVVFDPSWNPSNDLQAQDRAYRLGQTRDVEVFRLVATGTLEELVYRRQIYKQQQSNMVLEGRSEARYFEGVQGDKDKPGELWGLHNLLRFSGHTNETRDILNRYKEGSSERQRLEQQLQQQIQRVQQGQGASAAAAAAAAGSSVDDAKYEVVEVDDFVPADRDHDGDQDRTAAATSTAAAAAAAVGPSLLAGVLNIGDLAAAAAPEFLDDEDDAVAAGGLGGASVTRPKQQQQQQQRRDDSSRKRSRRFHQQQSDSHSVSDDEMESDEMGDDESHAQLQPQQQQHKQQRPKRQLQADSDSHSDAEHPAAAAVAAAAAGNNAPSAAAAAAVVEGTQGLESLVMALHDEGVVLQVHTHDAILGRGVVTAPRKPALKAGDSPQQQGQQHGTNKRSDSCTAAGGGAHDPRAAAVRHVSTAVLTAARSAADQGDDILASLAVWQQMDVVKVAELLLQLSSAERRELLHMYADEFATSDIVL